MQPMVSPGGNLRGFGGNATGINECAEARNQIVNFQRN